MSLISKLGILGIIFATAGCEPTSEEKAIQDLSSVSKKLSQEPAIKENIYFQRYGAFNFTDGEKEKYLGAADIDGDGKYEILTSYQNRNIKPQINSIIIYKVFQKELKAESPQLEFK